MFVWVDAVIWCSDLYNCTRLGAPGCFCFLRPMLLVVVVVGGRVGTFPYPSVSRSVPGVLAVHLGPVMQMGPSGHQEKSQITRCLPSQRRPILFLSH